tara:strand:- start:205 stop:471 length:267 start_codon:yes stop_codon:yes gene_type:complete
MTFSTLIDHGNYAGLPPTGVFIFWIVVSLVSLVGYGLYLTFGEGGKNLKDEIKEHARMHEMGIAHGHNSKGTYITTREIDNPRHNHEK